MRLIHFVKNFTGLSYEASEWLLLGIIAAILLVLGLAAWATLYQRRRAKLRRVSHKQTARLVGLVVSGKLIEAQVYWKQIGCPTSRQVHWGEHLPGDYHGDALVSRAMVDFFKAVTSEESAAHAPVAAAAT